MDRKKYAMLIAAVGAAGLITAGCQQKADSDKFGKSDQAMPPTIVGKAAPDQNSPPAAQPTPPSTQSAPMDQGKTDQSSSSDQGKDKASTSASPSDKKSG
jgi:hypothetical protein